MNGENFLLKLIRITLLFIFASSALQAQEEVELLTEQNKLIRLVESRALEISEGEINAAYWATLELGFSLLVGAGTQDGQRNFQDLEASIDQLEPDDDYIQFIAQSEDPDAIVAIFDEAKAGLRILNGFPVPSQKLKSTVGLVDMNVTKGCTAVVVGEGIALTAAHCVCGMQLGTSIAVGTGGWVHFGNKPPHDGSPKAAITYANVMDEKICEVKDNFCVPDVAVVFFDANVFPDKVSIARIADSTEAEAHIGSSASTVLAGFGYVRDYLAPAGTIGQTKNATSKQFTSIPKTLWCSKPRQCSYSPKKVGCIAGSDILVRDRLEPPYSKDACNGDSGGPAYLGNPLDGEEVVFGVISRALDSQNRCGYGTVIAEVYSQEVREWLNNEIETHKH